MRTPFRPAALALTALAALGWADTTLYTGTRSISDQGIALRAWGSGTAAESDDAAYEGTTSVRVSSRNFFQGGILNMQAPVDLSAAYADASNLLAFTLYIPKVATSGGGGGGTGPGASGGGGRGNSQAGDGGEQGGRGGGGATVVAPTEGLQTIRVVLTTSDGKKSEAFLKVGGLVADQRGWVRAAVPLQAIKGLGASDKKVTSMALAGDTVGTFYVGQASILNDSTPVYGEASPAELNLALGDEVTFSGNGSAGWSPLKYQWDFDSSNGVQVDAEGQFVKRRFLRPGDYVVTLTVVDAYGLKKPHTSTVKVTVNP